MKKYILIYEVNDYCEMGGGTHFEEFQYDSELDKRAEEIVLEGHTITAAGELVRYTYKAVEKVTKVERE